MICDETIYSLKTISNYDISNYDRKISPRKLRAAAELIGWQQCCGVGLRILHV